MTPNMRVMGIMLGMSEISPPLKEVNMADMIRKITPSRITRDLTWAIMRFSEAAFTIRFSPTT